MREFWLNQEHARHQGSGTPESSNRLSLINPANCIIKKGNVSQYSSYFSLAHDKVYLQKLEEEAIQEHEAMCNAGSWQAMASGTALCLEAADSLIKDGKKTFILTRPPGHHAHTDWTHGFCFINNAALTALYLHERHNKKVAVLDFDLHNGDGTEDILNKKESNRLLFISTYQADIFPGPRYNLQVEGMRGDTYHLPLHGTMVDFDFIKIISKIKDRLRQFSPEVLVVSAGFDMNRHESASGLMPSSMQLTRRSYEKLNGLCGEYPSLAILEGGYSPKSIKEGLEAFSLR